MSRRAESAPSEEHQELVDGLAKYMRDKLKLRLEGVEHDDYPKKSRLVNGHRPDVIAYDPAKELRYVGEAKTPDDITNNHTKEQLDAWENRVMLDGKSKDAKLPILVIVSLCKLSGASLNPQRLGSQGSSYPDVLWPRARGSLEF